jgi:outer membrane protein assembly factor BamE
MKQILILLLIGLSLPLGGCTKWGDFTLVHKPDIQQGNIITPEMVGALKTGMSKRQVSFVLGTPLLTDVFHQDRWDYPFSMKKRNEPQEIKLFSLFFEGDVLVDFSGDIEPVPISETEQAKQEIIVSVPDYQGDEGVIEQALGVVGIDIDD